ALRGLLRSARRRECRIADRAHRPSHGGFRPADLCLRRHSGEVLPAPSSPSRYGFNGETIASAIAWNSSPRKLEVFSRNPGGRFWRGPSRRPPPMETLRADAADELLGRRAAPLRDQRFFGRQEMALVLHVEAIGVGPVLVHAAPRIGPVVV